MRLAAQDEALPRFQERFAAGMAALRAGETSKAFRAFTECEGLAADLPESHRAGASFAATLFVLETTLHAGQLADAELLARVQSLRARAVASGAWTTPFGEALRVRALVLLWRVAPEGEFARHCADEDRHWLLRDDFFTLAPERLPPLHGAARVLRLALAIGGDAEPAALADLAEHEEAVATALAAGRALAADDVEWRAIALSALCRYHLERRSFDRAQVYADRLPPERSLDVRSLLALQREDHGQAAALARELVRQGDVRGHGLLADALEASGHAEDALPHYDKALAAATTPGARAAAHNGRGDCLLALHEHEPAAAAYAAALRECDAGGLGLLAERAETQKDQGRLHEALGDPAAAQAAFLAALATGEQARERLLRDPFGGSWLRVHGDQLTAIDGVLRTWQAARAEPWEVVRALELGRARGLLDAVAGQPPQVPVAALQELLAARLLARDPAAVARLDAELEVLRARAAATPIRVAVPTAGELRSWCQERGDATFLLYWLGRTQAWVLVVRGDVVHSELLGEAATARRHVAGAFAAVASPDGDLGALAAAGSWLLPPAIVARLGADVRVVLDTAMTRLPFEALLRHVRPGVRNVVWRVPSLASARRLRRPAGGGGGALVVDDASDAATVQQLGLDALVFSRREGDAVAAAHGGAVHLRGAAASFAALRTATAGQVPDLLHVSAHAVQCPGFPSQTLLLLGDGPVAMAAFGDLRLHGATVVLSACGAGVGEQRGQEGTLGLVEGAFAAGAATVVAPIAEVNQQATADLMTQFHHRLAAGDDVATALAAAREVLATAAQYRHPHHWATFAAYGELVSPGPGRSRPGWWWAVALVAGAAAVMAWRWRSNRAQRQGRIA